MDISGLKVFLAVAETAGFTRAAHRLHCVQPNVTAQIKKLEENLGVRLFYRESRQVKLTAHGRELVGRARQILAMVRDTESRFTRQAPAGQLNLGVTQTAAAALLPEILRTYIRDCPEVEINVQSLFVETMTTQLLNHELDCALTDLSIEHPLLRYRLSRPQRLMLVHAVDYPCSPHEPVTVLSFSRASRYRRLLLAYLRRLRIPVARELTLKGMDAVISCLIGRVGVSLLPEAVTRLPHLTPHINAITLDEAEGRVGVLTHINHVETAAQSVFMRLAQSVIDKS